MGIVNVSRIKTLYTEVFKGLQAVTAGARAAIHATISAFFQGLDCGFVAGLLSWAMGKVIDAVLDLEAKALSIALRCEYLYRARKVSVTAARNAWTLTNKCSRCKCIGHNKQNHSSDIDAFLKNNRLESYMEDAESLIGATEEDGWWSWLTG